MSFSVFASSAKADTGVRFVDVNGDGLVDMLEDYLNGSQTSSSWLNNGSGWVSDVTWKSPESFTKAGVNTGLRLVDINGDGFSDIAFSVGARNYTWVRNDTRAYLLYGIVNEYGGVTNITYNYSTAYDNKILNISQIGISLPVVGAIIRNNSMNGSFAIVAPVNYSYAGGKYSYYNNEFRGFAYSNESYPSKIISHTWYQDDARKGKVIFFIFLS